MYYVANIISCFLTTIAIGIAVCENTAPTDITL